MGDDDIECELAANALKPREVVQKLRDDMRSFGHSETFFVSALRTQEFDLPALVGSVAASVCSGRRTQHARSECPICYESYAVHEGADSTPGREPCPCLWCANTICKECAMHLQDVNDAATCPFCRR